MCLAAHDVMYISFRELHTRKSAKHSSRKLLPERVLFLTYIKNSYEYWPFSSFLGSVLKLNRKVVEY